MGNSVLIRCEAEMTLLQPHLGDTRCQELSILSHSFVPLSIGQGGGRDPP